jgi:RNA polymerase sigma factor (sigma-70 family)
MDLNELVVKYQQTHDEEILEQIIKSSKGFILKTAKTYSSSHDLDDLYQVGTIGLLEAVNRFDVNLGYGFLSYAVHWIKKEMIDEIRNKNTIRVPDRMMDVFSAYEKERVKGDFNFEEFIAKMVTKKGNKYSRFSEKFLKEKLANLSQIKDVMQHGTDSDVFTEEFSVESS